MTHIAIVEQLDGKTVDWMEKVSDEEYKSGSDPASETGPFLQRFGVTRALDRGL
jgi:hypothetical protein